MTKRRDASAGFTLLEAMLSLALMSAIVAGLSTLTAQWLPAWSRGFAKVQSADILGLGLERVTADIAAAQYVTPNGRSADMLFDGKASSITFVRDALDPAAAQKLEITRIAETTDARGLALVRTRAPFTPLMSRAEASGIVFADPVVLARAPFRIVFSYAGPDRQWRPAWPSGKTLPTAVRVMVRDARTDQVVAASTALVLKVTAAGLPPADDKAAAPADEPAAAKTAPNPT